MKTVALYLRVSTVDQHPETQLHDLRAVAQQRGFQIVAEYTDRISGTKARRPGLDDLLRDARRGAPPPDSPSTRPAATLWLSHESTNRKQFLVRCLPARP